MAPGKRGAGKHAESKPEALLGAVLTVRGTLLAVQRRWALILCVFVGATSKFITLGTAPCIGCVEDRSRFVAHTALSLLSHTQLAGQAPCQLPALCLWLCEPARYPGTALTPHPALPSCRAPSRRYPFAPSFADGSWGEKRCGAVRFRFNTVLGTLILL